MRIVSLLNGHLWFGFNNKEIDWHYGLIEYWSWRGVWVIDGGDSFLYKKWVREL